MIAAGALAALSLVVGGLQSEQRLDPEQTPPVVLQDVEVQGRATPAIVRDFVSTVAAPAAGRGLARWEAPVCPGAANLSPVVAQAILDRITLAAQDVGIRTGKPGCDPNLVVLFTDDGGQAVREMASRNPELLRPNVTGNNRGEAAFREFLQSDRAVRWWSLSLPVDSQTGQRAVRVPGDRADQSLPLHIASAISCNPADCPLSFAPLISSTSASRLKSQIADNLYKTIIVVDVRYLENVDSQQLGDYLAFVGLAQVDPAASTENYHSILNLFTEDPPVGLTDWDRSYLAGLYGARAQLRSVGSQADEIVARILRDRRQAARAEAEPR